MVGSGSVVITTEDANVRNQLEIPVYHNYGDKKAISRSLLDDNHSINVCS